MTRSAESGPTETTQDTDDTLLFGSVDAVILIIRLSARYGPLMFHHGTDDGENQPSCRPVGSIVPDDDDIKLGEVAGCEYWIEPEALASLGGGELLLDVFPAHDDMFPGSPLNDRFVLRRIARSAGN